MVADDANDLVLFQDVRVIRSTPPVLLCRIGGRSVWLPRTHISGKLWCTGDRGKLYVRRWVARERNLIDLHGAAISSPEPSVVRSHLPVELHLMRTDQDADHGK
jgi:hypothetical protein